MCAAPGSKTAQLIEMIHTDENKPIPGERYFSYIKFHISKLYMFIVVFLFQMVLL